VDRNAILVEAEGCLAYFVIQGVDGRVNTSLELLNTFFLSLLDLFNLILHERSHVFNVAKSELTLLQGFLLHLCSRGSLAQHISADKLGDIDRGAIVDFLFQLHVLAPVLSLHEE
jgi:hypothetical protein